ncbi:MAG: ABC transporter permease [Planctomycetes bacterium]|nr:ABC transporter permease [Planctomycetota bacterium]
MPRRVWRLVRFELAKLFRQKLPYVVLFPIFAAVALVILHGMDVGEARENPMLRNGFEYLTASCLWALRLVSVFAVVLASLSLSSEASFGTYRMVLVRPVTRTDVFVSKVLVVAIIVAALFILTVLVSWGLLHLVHGFWRDGHYMSPLTDGKFTLMGEEVLTDPNRTKAVLQADFFRALRLSFLPLLASGFFGLLISSIFDNTGAAVGLAMFFAIFLYGFASVERTAGRYVFINSLEYGFTVAGHRARGLSDKKWEEEEIERTWVVPLLSGAAFLGAAYVIFVKRDILT